MGSKYPTHFIKHLYEGFDSSLNANTEKKILANVRADVKMIEESFKPMEKGKNSLAKHVTELRNVMRVRLDTTKQLKVSLQKKKAEIGGYDTQLGKLGAAIAQQAEPDKKIVAQIASRQKKVIALKKQVQVVERKMVKMDADNVKAETVLKRLEDLNIQLDKVSGQSGSTLSGVLKERFTSVDGLIGLSGDLGGLVGGISGAHA